MVKVTDSIKTALNDIGVALDRLWMCVQVQEKKDKGLELGLGLGLAGGPWRTDKPPRDGTEILAHYDDDPDYVVYITWAGNCWWHCGDGDAHGSDHDPERWAYVNVPAARCKV